MEQPLPPPPFTLANATVPLSLLPTALREELQPHADADGCVLVSLDVDAAGCVSRSASARPARLPPPVSSLTRPADAQELNGHILEIKAKADQSEAMVQEICRDIKKLDFAKKNLTSTITALRRLGMLGAHRLGCPPLQPAGGRAADPHLLPLPQCLLWTSWRTLPAASATETQPTCWRRVRRRLGSAPPRSPAPLFRRL